MDSIALAKKLVIRPGNRVLLLNQDALFAEAIAGNEGVSIETRQTSGNFDAVILFVNNIAELEKFVPVVTSVAPGNVIIWIAYPKGTSGIKTDISRDHGWETIHTQGFIPVSQVSFNEIWSLLRFKRASDVKHITRGAAIAPRKELVIPADFLGALSSNHLLIAFEKMAFTHRREFSRWIEGANKEETRKKRIVKAITMIAGNRKLNQNTESLN